MRKKSVEETTVVGEGSVFSCISHVPLTHNAYLKPPVDFFLTTLHNKNRRSSQEWKYVNPSGCGMRAP